MNRTTEARFWARVNQAGGPDACWPWSGNRAGKGYGRVGWAGRKQQAHRVAYMLAVGSIPDGLFVCHHCDNPPCCNPAHLFLGTNTDNARDMAAKGRAPAQMYPDRIRPPTARAHGSQFPNARFTEAQIVDIRARGAHGEIGEALAREFGVSQSTMSDILARRSWRHVE